MSRVFLEKTQSLSSDSGRSLPPCELWGKLWLRRVYRFPPCYLWLDVIAWALSAFGSALFRQRRVLFREKRSQVKMSHVASADANIFFLDKDPVSVIND